MRRVSSRLVLFSFGVSLGSTPQVEGSAAAKVRRPLGFEANLGQTDPQVGFLARLDGYRLFLTPSEAVFVRDLGAEGEAGCAPAVFMKFQGAEPRPVLRGLGPMPGKSHYYLSPNREDWITGVPHYAKVLVEGLYPGIDATFYITPERTLEYDLVIDAGVDPRQIVIGFEGAERVEVDPAGDLVINTRTGELRHRRPRIYQDGIGAVSGKYVIDTAQRVRFELSELDPTKPVVIDPVITYATLLGGTFGDTSGSIAVGEDGKIYVGGRTVSPDFPTRNPAQSDYDDTHRHPNATDAFLTVLTADGTDLVYSTYYGGPNEEIVRDEGVAVDVSGNAYFAGDVSQRCLAPPTPCPDDLGFPTTPGAFVETASHPSLPGFVVKLDPTGTVVYATYLPGAWNLRAVAASDGGQAFVAGIVLEANASRASEFITTPSALQPECNWRSDDACLDAFLAVLSPDGSSLDYATFLGGTDDLGGAGGTPSAEYGHDVAVDSAGHAYVVGLTASSDFPTTAGAFMEEMQRANCPFQCGRCLNSDAFVVKIDSAASGAASLVYGTYLGTFEATFRCNSAGDWANAIVVDGSGNAYVTGVTNGRAEFPLVDPIPSAGDTGFLSKLNPSGSALVYSTLLPFNQGNDVGIDGGGNAYVLFEPGGTLVMKVSAAGSSESYRFNVDPSWSSRATAMAVSGAGAAYVTGWDAGGIETTADAYQPDRAGGTDVYVVKIEDPPIHDLRITKSESVDPVLVGAELTYTLEVTNLGPDDASGVTITDTLPADVIFLSASAGCGESGGVVTCGPSLLAAGDALAVAITVTPTAAGAITNSASVSGAGADPNPADNTASAETDVLPASVGAEVTLTKTAPDLRVIGLPIRYRLTVENQGPHEATDVTIVDRLSPQLRFDFAGIRCRHAGGSTGGTVTCGPITMAPGLSRTFEFFATSNEIAVIENTAEVSAVEPDFDPDNNVSTAVTEVVDPEEHVVVTDQRITTSERVLAGNSITAKDGYIVAASGDVSFVAGATIVLDDGFSVESGGQFVARIEPGIQ